MDDLAFTYLTNLQKNPVIVDILIKFLNITNAFAIIV
jgi:hypothetical protein